MSHPDRYEKLHTERKMIDNTAAPADAASGGGSIRPRYAPPNQRSRSLSRRKSGDHGSSSGRSHNNSSSSSPSFEGEREREKQQHHPPSSTRSSNTNTNTNTNANDNTSNIINLQGCSSSQAAQLLSNRWSATIQAYNDPSLPPSEKPVLYSGSGTSAWGQPRLSHQMDFLTELQRAVRDAKASPDA